MMKAIWSFWSKPYIARRGSTWLCDKHHLLSWGLSVETARKHYPETFLFTDDDGAQIIAEIGLEFDYVSTELNVLKNHDADWWALGKLYTYKAQTEPFIHIDNDVFLWKPLPESMEHAPLLGQNSETLGWFYNPDQVEEAIMNGGGWASDEWKWYRSIGSARRAVNCGIFGGNRIDFINYYANQAITMIEHPRNRLAWETKGKNSILPEQYLLSACIEYHRNRPGSPFKEIDLQYLFNSWEDAYIPEKAAQAGYTHLIADAKRNQFVVERLENRVRKTYPRYYERCMNYVENASG